MRIFFRELHYLILQIDFLRAQSLFRVVLTYLRVFRIETCIFRFNVEPGFLIVTVGIFRHKAFKWNLPLNTLFTVFLTTALQVNFIFGYKKGLKFDLTF